LPGINRAVFGITLMATELLRGQRVSPDALSEAPLQQEAFMIGEELNYDP
jgi:hypothetical protein